MRSEFEDDFEPPQRPKRKLMKSLYATTFSGRDVAIQMYDHMPPYFDRPIDVDLQWIPNTPLEDLSSATMPEQPLVDKYIARKYGHLVSDEKTNREVLMWLQSFRDVKIKTNKKKRKGSKSDKEDPKINELKHILLLSGPPGCGKSTLIRVVAAQCGYHIVELNASEDASSPQNQRLLHDQLNFKPVFGANPTRPLLVLEEMDGIGTLHESVVKAIFNMHGKPVVVVVNDPYNPSMRTIRAAATVVRMPPPEKTKFVQRLKRICDKEAIAADAAALTEIAEVSRLDMRTALNTLQFLAMRQPVTLEMVQLMPVGVKNAALTPFDLWTALFTSSTKMEDLLLMMESFGDNPLLVSGVLENCENFRSLDATGHKISEMLDDLCYADCAYGEVASLGLANIPKLHGVSRVPKGSLFFPTNTFSKESQIRKNSQLLAKHAAIKKNFDLIDLYLNPSITTTNVLAGRAGIELRNRFVGIHKMMKMSYKKNSFGHYTSEPDVDGLLEFDGRIAHLSRFREIIQRELDKEQADIKKIVAQESITDKLKEQKGLKKKQREEVSFWIPRVEEHVVSLDVKPKLVYKHNEGHTKAVKRSVYLQRILA